MYKNVNKCFKNKKHYRYLGFHIYDWADDMNIPYDEAYKAYANNTFSELLFLYNGCNNVF